MFDMKPKWDGHGTFEYVNKDRQLIIVDRFSLPKRRKLSLDVNIFNDNSDTHIFTELFVTPARLRYIVDLFQFNKNIINKICNKKIRVPNM